METCWSNTAAPWARATPAGAKVGGAYLKITNNGTQPDRLVGGSLTGAREVEVHEMSMANNVMKMRHLKDGLEIKPGQTVELKPGGYHLMLTGLSDGLKQGQNVRGSLTFEKAGTVEVEYTVAPVGAASGGTCTRADDDRPLGTRPWLKALAQGPGSRPWLKALAQGMSSRLARRPAG